jgi:hypothetical protein
MLTDFYIAFATVCFTLLGLWLIVVQTRHAEWRPRKRVTAPCMLNAGQWTKSPRCGKEAP